MTVTDRASHRAATFFRPGTITLAACHQHWHLDRGLGAADGFFQRQLQVITQVRATLHATTLLASTAENIAEYVAENIAETFRTTETAATTHGWIDAGMAELIVGRTLFGIGQNLVGFLDLFEFLLGVLGIILVPIRMVFHRHAPIAFLDLGFTGVSIDFQQFIKIFFCGHFVMVFMYF